MGNISITNASGIKSLFLRGQHSAATKVLYNGIDLKDVSGTNGAPLFELIPVEDVKRIEVISGSKGTLYGSGAIAGVINVITDTASQDGFVFSEVAYNSYNTTFKGVTSVGKTTFSLIGNQQNDASLSAQSSDTEIDQRSQQSLTFGFSHDAFIRKN